MQGKIYRGKSIKTKTNVIIKETNIKLHETQTAIVNGKRWRVYENIIKEKTLMLKLQQRNPPQS